MTISRLFHFLLMLLPAGLGLAAGDPASPVPVEDLFAAGSRDVFRLSPTGNHVAIRRAQDGRNTLCVADPENLAATTRSLDLPAGSSVVSFFWASEDLLALVLIVPGRGRIPGTLLVDDKPGGSVGSAFKPLAEAEALADLAGCTRPVPGSPVKILITVPSSGDPAYSDIFSIDPVSTARGLILRNTDRVAVWLADADASTLAGIRGKPDGSMELLAIHGGKTHVLMGTDPGDSLNLAGVTPDGSRAFILTDHGSDFLRLEEVDLATGTRRVVADDPCHQVDMEQPVFDRSGTTLLGITCRRDFVTTIWRTAAMAGLHDRVRELLPPGEVRIVEGNSAGDKWMVEFVSDRAPDRVYFFNAATGKLVRLDTCSTEIPPECLGRTSALGYHARDGTLVPAYLTLPPDGGERGLPVVVFAHGGPARRAVWGFDPRVQFLATRGYAVLQPNFRGSSGYGKKYQNAGNRQWGRGVMQDDLSDGVAWLVKEGIADPERVAIMGGSYGGYATLAGVAFTPDLYAAGVCLFGASDLPAFVRDVPPRWKPFLGNLHVQIGNLDCLEDRRRMEWQSPIHSVAAIKAPLLVYQGGGDDLIRLSQADNFVRACRAEGVSVDYLLNPQGGHGFEDPADEAAVYRAIGGFLARHLGGTPPPATPDASEQKISGFRCEGAKSLSRQAGVAPE